MIEAQYRLLTEGLEGRSPAAGHGHVDGRHAHLALGEDAPGVHRTPCCRWPVCRPRSRAGTASGGGSSSTPSATTRRGRMASTRRSRRACGPRRDALLHVEQPGATASRKAPSRERRTGSSTSTSRRWKDDGRQRRALRDREFGGLRPGSGPGADRGAAAGDQLRGRPDQPARTGRPGARDQAGADGKAIVIPAETIGRARHSHPRRRLEGPPGGLLQQSEPGAK